MTWSEDLDSLALVSVFFTNERQHKTPECEILISIN